MRSFSIALLLFGCSAGSAMAFDVTTAAVVQSYVSSQLTSAPFDNKLIAEAREDAAGFVASEGSSLRHACRPPCRVCARNIGACRQRPGTGEAILVQ